MDAYPLTSEEVLFRDCMLVCRIPEETMVNFRRCNLGTTAELMSAAGGVLEIKPPPEGALEATLVSLAHGGTAAWGDAAGTDAEKTVHTAMLGRLSLLCSMCRDDFADARMRLRDAHRAAHGIPSSSVTMEVRKKLKADPRPKVT